MNDIVVSTEEWLKARRELLAAEKEFTERQEEMSRLRRALPWVKVEKSYVFDTPKGKATFAKLFGVNSQLAVYHFMFGPDWKEGCPGCSFLADHVDGAPPHLNARDVTFVMVSRAPLEKIEAFKKRMGWKMPWVSSLGTDFNRDFGVTFTKEQVASGEKLYNFGTLAPYGEENHGFSAFYKDPAGEIFHTYSVFARGCEPFLGTYTILDLMAKGRDEDGLPEPMSWLRHHDKYENQPPVAGSCCQHGQAKS